MPKLIDNRSTAKLGRDGLLALIDEFNAKRAYMGIRDRYKPLEVNGVLTMGMDALPHGVDPYSHSPNYSAPRLVHSSN